MELMLVCGFFQVYRGRWGMCYLEIGWCNSDLFVKNGTLDTPNNCLRNQKCFI